MEHNAKHAWEMISKLDICTLVSKGDQGFTGRPMSSIPRPDQQAIYFISVTDSPQITEILANPTVFLAYGDGAKNFLCAEGDATISTDRELIAELWNPGAQAFWPEGPEKAPVSVITVTPRRGEYWEGYNAAVTAAKVVFALATRTTADMGENRTFRI